MRATLSRRLRRRAPTPPGADSILAAFATATAHRDVTFVQVGANDGVTSDPLRALADRHRWAGVLVEPVPHVFARLRIERGGNLRLVLERAAVADHDGTAELFYLATHGEALPERYAQLSSLSLPTILGHADEIPDLRARLRTRLVPCLTFDSLCAKHGLEQVDLIHLDVEGYGWELLQRIDLARYGPALVLYAHCHLPPAERVAAHAYLAAYGYRWFEDERDTICAREEALAALAPVGRAWARLGTVTRWPRAGGRR